MTEFASDQSVQQTLEAIISEYQLKVELVMSKSGTNHVLLCRDKKNLPYIVKILRRTDAKSQPSQFQNLDRQRESRRAKSFSRRDPRPSGHI